MKTITFKYTKKDNSVSERTILVQVQPGGDKYAGIDLSELQPLQAAVYINEATDLHDEYVRNMKALQAKHDVKFAYKTFLVSGMSDITEI